MTDEYFHCVLEHAQSHSLFSTNPQFLFTPPQFMFTYTLYSIFLSVLSPLTEYILLDAKFLTLINLTLLLLELVSWNN